MKLKIGFLIFFLSVLSNAQETNILEKELNINVHVDGTLLLPKSEEKPDLVIIIPGSGPTNRDGNQNFLKSNCLKKLAEGLSDNGIATFRYDKRVVKQIREGNVDSNIKFDDFVMDAITVLEYFKSKKEFNKIYIMGHSQGSLVGMLAAKKGADGFISLAGAGQTIDKVIIDQITTTAPMLADDTENVFKILREGKIAEDFPPALVSIFNLEIQPFIMNWMQYDPKTIISELEVPVLIINGTQDIQIPETEAKLLLEGNPNAEIKIIDKMNHVLVSIEGDRLENTKAYNEPNRELSVGLISSIVAFIQ